MAMSGRSQIQGMRRTDILRDLSLDDPVAAIVVFNRLCVPQRSIRTVGRIVMDADWCRRDAAGRERDTLSNGNRMTLPIVSSCRPHSAGATQH
jgi:hypothetical protein